MRISCASFVRLTDPEGGLALLVNKNQYEQDKIVLVPIGGAMQVSTVEGYEIMRLLNLAETDFDKPPTDVVDLRFTVDDSLEEEVRRLYPTWDADPSRELYEELVEEQPRILTDAEFNAANFTLTFAGVKKKQYRLVQARHLGRKRCGSFRSMTCLATRLSPRRSSRPAVLSSSLRRKKLRMDGADRVWRLHLSPRRYSLPSGISRALTFRERTRPQP